MGIDEEEGIDPVYDIAFPEDDNPSEDGILFQDFFRFAIEEKGLEPFKFTELANWLLDHNVNLRNEFAGSHMPKTYRVHSKSSFIKTRLNEMMREGYIEEIGKTKAEKNNQSTPLYRFTLNSLKTLSFLYDDINEQKYNTIRSKHRDIFYRLAKSELDSHYSIENKFCSNLIEKLYQQVGFEDFITISDKFIPFLTDFRLRLNVFSLFFPWLGAEYVGLGYRDAEVVTLVTKPQISSLVLETLNQLDPESREVLLFELKFGIEDSYYWECSTPEFERLRIKNISNKNKITIQTKCSKCQSCSPVTVNLNDLLQRHSGLIDESHEFPCPKCDSDGLRKRCKIIKTNPHFDTFKASKYENIPKGHITR